MSTIYTLLWVAYVVICLVSYRNLSKGAAHLHANPKSSWSYFASAGLMLLIGSWTVIWFPGISGWARLSVFLPWLIATACGMLGKKREAADKTDLAKLAR